MESSEARLVSGTNQKVERNGRHRGECLELEIGEALWFEWLVAGELISTADVTSKSQALQTYQNKVELGKYDMVSRIA